MPPTIEDERVLAYLDGLIGKLGLKTKSLVFRDQLDRQTSAQTLEELY